MFQSWFDASVDHTEASNDSVATTLRGNVTELLGYRIEFSPEETPAGEQAGTRGVGHTRVREA